MKLKLTVLTLIAAMLVVLAAFFPAAAETAAPAPANYSESELNEKLEQIVLKLYESGIGCTAYDVNAGSIRIAVPHSRLTAAKNALSRLDLIKNEPELPVLLFSDSLPDSGVEGGERIVPASGRIKPSMMLAVVFGVVCLILFYPVHRARQRQIQMMQMRR